MRVLKNLYENPEIRVNENGTLAASTTTVDYKDVHHFNEDGTPVFKKHLRERTILTKRSRADKVIFGIAFVIFLIHCISIFMPTLWMLMSSFKTDSAFTYDGCMTLPWNTADGFTFQSYIDALNKMSITDQTGAEIGFVHMVGFSLWYTVTGMALSVFLPTMTAYVLSRYRFAGRHAIYTVVIASMMIPIVGTTGAAIRFFNEIGIYNTLLFPIIATLGAGFGSCFIVFYGFFKTISSSYSEAARVDGAGHFTIFFKIILPQALPIIFTYAITFSIERWNDYTTVLLYMPDWPTLAAGMYIYKETGLTTGGYPIYFAGLILAAIPPVVLFAMFSQKIMTSISIGGLKG